MINLGLEERDRRWNKVRGEMARQGLECLVIYGISGRYRQITANIRYLANDAVDGYLVFPLNDDPTLVWFISRPGHGSWVEDNRSGQPRFSRVIGERLRELHMEKVRIGVVGLSGYDGELGFPHATYESLVRQFPGAEFTDATEILLGMRRIKSPAEIECFERGGVAGRKAHRAVRENVRAGTHDYEVKLRIQDTLYAEGCEPGSLLLAATGSRVIHAGQGNFYRTRAENRLEKGDIILTEFDAVYCGYMAEFNQPFSVGEPDDELKTIFSVAGEAFNSGYQALRPGITIGEWNEKIMAPILKAGYTYTNPAFHGLGLSLEEPMAPFPLQPEHQPDLSFTMQPGMVVELEPHVVTPDYRRGLTVGSSLLVTDQGCRLLSESWEPELIVLEG